MIDRTSELVGKVAELKDLISQLDGKTINVDVGGNANAVLDEIAGKLNALDNRTLIVNMEYKNLRPGQESLQPIVQPVIDQVIGSRDTTKLREQFQDVITTSAPEAGQTAGEVDAVSAALRVLQEQMDNDKATLATLRNAMLAAVDAMRQMRVSAGELSDTSTVAAASEQILDRAMNDAGVSAAQQLSSIRAVTNAKRELGLQAAAVAAATDKETNSTFDQTAATLASIDATLTGVNAARLLADAVKLENDAGRQAIPLWEAGNGIFGAWNPKIQLFGGLLTRVGVPAILATASAFHIVIDSVLEIASTLIPAAIAFGVFAAAASGDVQDIYKQMQNLHTVTTAFGVSIYPMTGALQQLQDAVRPEVYTLFGEGLTLVTRNLGLFQQIAVGAGKVLDDLGARFVYAVTHGNSFSTFIHNAVKDLAGWGNLIGNIGGIFGAIFGALPGYGEMFLSLAQAVTHVLEVIAMAATPVIRFGLALHGALLWAGLAVTGLVALRGPLTALSGWVLGAILNLIDLGATFLATAAEEGVFAATTGALGAIDPFIWVVAAIGLIVGLGVALGNTKDGVQQFNAAMNSAIQNSSLSNLSSTIASAQAASAVVVTEATDRVTQANNAYTASVKTGTEAVNLHTGEMTQQYAAYAQTVQQQQEAVAGQKTIDQTAQLVNSRMAELSKTYGGNTAALALMNAAGITSGQITDTNNQHWAEAQIEIQAQANAMNALAIGSGRTGAAMNALGNSFMTETLPAMQKVTQAEDNLINVILSGRQTFNAFQQSILGTTATFVAPTGLAQAAKLAGGNLTGLGQQSLAFSNTLYSESIPAAQKMFDALQQQGIGTSDLTKVVATSAGEMLQYVGNNVEARTVIVDLINNALGPGTVSLQSLNKWVSTNGTTLQAMNGIVAKSTIAVSGLANVISGELDSAMSQAIIQANGGTQAFNTAADAVKTMHGQVSNLIPTANNLANVMLNSLGGNVDLAKQKFYEFYHQMGLTDGQINTLWSDVVNKLTPALKNIPSPHTTLTESASGVFTLGGMQLTGYQALQIAAQNPAKHAAGGIIPGYSPGNDVIPALLSPGEGILTPQAVRMIGGGTVHSLNTMAKHFAAGGLADGSPVGRLATFTTGFGEAFAGLFQNDMAGILAGEFNGIKAGVAALQKKIQQTGGAGFSVPGMSVPGNFSQWLAQAIALTGVPFWWGPGLDIIARYESGFNPNAINLTDSNAAAGDPSRGLMQTIMTTFDAYHMPGTSWNIYDPVANIAAAIRYILARYGNVNNVPGVYSVEHGGGYVGYDAGGVLPPGITHAVNESGAAEWVLTQQQLQHLVKFGLGSHVGSINREAQMLKDLMQVPGKGTQVQELARQFEHTLHEWHEQHLAHMSHIQQSTLDAHQLHELHLEHLKQAPGGVNGQPPMWGHVVVQVSGKTIFDAVKPFVMQYAQRNNGNAFPASSGWSPRQGPNGKLT